jgi:hypothetical protein
MMDVMEPGMAEHMHACAVTSGMIAVHSHVQQQEAAWLLLLVLRLTKCCVREDLCVPICPRDVCMCGGKGPNCQGAVKSDQLL